MNLALYIARRYLFSKKSHHAINIISGISVCGVAFATLALVCTLSVFNGFRDLVAGLFTAFDPELKITTVHGKTFESGDSVVKLVREIPEVEVATECVEENAMIRYGGRQAVVTVKGVEDNFVELTAIDSILYGNGVFKLHDELVDYGVPGVQLAASMGTGVHPVNPIEVFAPKRDVPVNMGNPASGFRRSYLFSPGVVFAVNQDKYDASYVLTSLAFARNLFGYDDEVTSLELKLTPEANVNSVQQKIQRVLGEQYRVENRYEQQADVFRIMEIEKLISYLFLTFILLVACFNIVGSLSMLIIDKKEDVLTLRNLGADNRLITRIFLFEGWLISLFGALLGIVLGVGLCLLQQHYGLIALGAQGGFLVDAYPVSVEAGDIALVFVTVSVVGLLSVCYPVFYLSKRLLTHKD
ncbi:MAG: FtsX-like permease family protein [Bacteroidaceae bacterium]|nr:FtsX-like permease family protein [Bacteroidaceae bacterium]